jgi:hypothetical protein
LKQSLIFWKRTVSKMLTSLWRIVNEKSVLKTVMDDAKKKSQKRKLNADALEETVSRKIPRVEIPITPYVSSDDLRLLYLQEIISWQTYCEYLLRNSSLPKGIIFQKQDPWSRDDKKELLGLKPEPVAPAQPVTKPTSSSSNRTDAHGTKNVQSSKTSAGSKLTKA